MKKLYLYFAHPVNTYGTTLEEECLKIIAQYFPNHEVVNPGDQIHKDVVEEIKKNDPKANVMPYFENLTAPCDVIVVLPFGDEKWGAGVYGEAAVIDAKNGLMYEIWPALQSVSFLAELPTERALSVEETRARIYSDPVKRTLKAYE